jgi:hypothetical protein
MLTGSGDAPDGVGEMRGASSLRLATTLAIALGATVWLWTQL